MSSMSDNAAVERRADIFRSMARHEAEQVHRRISWLAGFQGFLFAAVGVSWSKSQPLTRTFALLGLTVAMLVFAGILAATWAVQRIRRDWSRERPKDYRGPDIMGFYPDKIPLSVYLSGELLLPVAFVAAWVRILMIA